MIVKGRRWPVPMYRFYAVKRLLRISPHSPLTHWDYSHYVYTGEWTPFIPDPVAYKKGYHVYANHRGPTFYEEPYLVECALANDSKLWIVMMGYVIACNSIRFVSPYVEAMRTQLIGDPSTFHDLRRANNAQA